MKKNTKNTSFLQTGLIWIPSILFYFYINILLSSATVLATYFMHDFSLNATAVSALSSYYFYAYAGMQIPVGILIDRFGTRTLLTLAAILCGVGCILLGLTHYFVYAKLARFLIGFGSAFALIGSLSIAAQRFDTKYFGLITGFLVAAGMLGGFCGIAILSPLIQIFGWRLIICILGILGFLISLSLWISLRKTSADTNQQEELVLQKIDLITGLKHVLAKRQNWLSALFTGFVYLPTAILCTLWGVPFLFYGYHISQALAATLIAMIFLGWIIGSPLFGKISDHVGRRKPFLYIGLIGLLIADIIFIYTPIPALPLLFITLICIGFFSGSLCIGFAIVRESNSPKYTGTSLGFTNMLSMIGGALMPPVTGFLLDLNSRHTTIPRTYTLTDFHLALSTIPILLVVMLIFIPFIKETYCSSN